jgi:all-trans-retinol dehydrogenase (NAD+)
LTALRASVVLITGAAGGIGRLLALGAAARGATLVLWDRDPAGLERLRAELAAAGRPGPVLCHTLDLADRTAIAAGAQRAIEQLGRIDVLVNNAGVVTGKHLTEASDEDVLLSFAVNALAPIWTTRAFLPRMIDSGRGHVVTISSLAGFVGTSKLVDYCASKHAAVGFDEALRIELKRRGSPVRTTIVGTYYIDTGMFAGVRTRFGWLLPILDSQRVADRVLRAIERDEQRLIMPWFAYTLFPLKLLPIPVVDWLLDFFGISRGMDQFTGRRGG